MAIDPDDEQSVELDKVIKISFSKEVLASSIKFTGDCKDRNIKIVDAMNNCLNVDLSYSEDKKHLV